MQKKGSFALCFMERERMGEGLRNLGLGPGGSLWSYAFACPMSDAYDNVMRGRLKLKGKAVPSLGPQKAYVPVSYSSKQTVNLQVTYSVTALCLLVQSRFLMI
jgi:hypothetical protein